MNYSLTYAGLLVIIAGWLGIGDLITSENAAIIVNNVVQLIGIIATIYGRYRAGDVTIAGFKKGK